MPEVNHLIKRKISAVLAQIGALSARRRIPILLYHSVDDSGSVISMTPTEFKEHMKYLKAKEYQTISLYKFAESIRRDETPLSRSVVITFDDGFKNNYSEAFPILCKYGFTATIFIVTNHVDGICSWDGHESIPQMPLLSWQEIQEMSNHGIEFGSHGCSHSYLTQISEEKMNRELSESKSTIETQLGKPVSFFCHPYGDTDQKTQQAAKECGYLGAFGGLSYSLSNSNVNLYNLHRIGTARFRSIQDFKAGLVGTYDWYIKMKRIILYFLGVARKNANKDLEFYKIQ
jgi:peptidoglycan/xylan/chitin deacetylase (PgdA/CDA1 family)